MGKRIKCNVCGAYDSIVKIDGGNAYKTSKLKIENDNIVLDEDTSVVSDFEEEYEVGYKCESCGEFARVRASKVEKEIFTIE